MGYYTILIAAIGEDPSDTLHTQRNGIDSGYLFNVQRNYCGGTGLQPVRWLAQGRDPSATIDSALLGTTGFQNDGDNEITGLHVSDGDPGVHGLLGAEDPDLFADDGRWRLFYTAQHGDNRTYEVLSSGGRFRSS